MSPELPPSVIVRARRGRLVAGWAGLVLCVAGGCRQDMYDQPRYEQLEASGFFRDGRSARPPVPGTVARGAMHLREDAHLYTGRAGSELVDVFPFAVTLDVLRRGRERHEIFCSPCHDRVGTGLGMVVRRGFKRPPSYHSEEVRKKPVGHYFDVITRGYGVMQDYAAQVPARDRWAIAAYVRALQHSQRAPREDVPPEELRKLGADR